MWRGAWRRVRARGRAVCALSVCACALLLLCLPPPPAPLSTLAHFPRLDPRRLAHLLADFSTQTQLYPRIGSWEVEEESSNYSAWRYSVRYSCGARCSGHAHVLAVDLHAPPHAPHHAPPHAPHQAPHHAPPRPSAHRVLLTLRSCTRPAWLPWPASCEEWETDTRVESAVEGEGEAGAVLREETRGGCAGWGRGGACRDLLRAQAERRVERLRALLQNTSV